MGARVRACEAVKGLALMPYGFGLNLGLNRSSTAAEVEDAALDSDQAQSLWQCVQGL